MIYILYNGYDIKKNIYKKIYIITFILSHDKFCRRVLFYE
jgi:hypothetical protein